MYVNVSPASAIPFTVVPVVAVSTTDFAIFDPDGKYAPTPIVESSTPIVNVLSNVPIYDPTPVVVSESLVSSDPWFAGDITYDPFGNVNLSL